MLVIDDDEDYGTVLVEVLEHEGFTVRHALNGRRALELLDSEDVGAALLDWHLPDEDPEELARRLRERAVPFVLTSGGDRTQETGRAIGARAVLDKPFDLDALVRLLGSLLEPANSPGAYS